MKRNLVIKAFLALGLIFVLGVGGYFFYSSIQPKKPTEKESLSEEKETLETEIEKLKEKDEENAISQRKYEVLLLCQKFNFTGSSCQKTPPEELKSLAYRNLKISETWQIQYLCHCDSEEINKNYESKANDSLSYDFEFVHFKHLYKLYLLEKGLADKEIKEKLAELKKSYQENPQEYEKLKKTVESNF